MIELWGNDTCESCNQIRSMLGQTPLEWKYVDVANPNINYTGPIPLLVDTETGARIEYQVPIKNYVLKKLREMGFPVMTF